MKTKIQKTIIATSIASLFIAPVAAFAKDKWEYHEDKWGQVKSYGNVPLSQDSAGEWGPWSEFVQPAAGGPAVGFLPQVGGEKYRPLPPVTPPVADTCTAGAWCGFVAYANANGTYTYNSEEEYQSSEKFSRVYPGRIALTLSPDNPLGDGGEGPGKVSWLMSPLGDYPAPNLADSGAPLNAYFYSGLRDFNAYRYTNSGSTWDGAEGFGRPYSKWYAVDAPVPYSEDSYWYGLPTDNPEVTAGMVVRGVGSYTEGDNNYSEQWTASVGIYVAGIVTPQSHMDSEKKTAQEVVRLNELEQGPGYVEARYVGNSVDFSGERVPVEINVNFANSTWGGSWNEGQDGFTQNGYDSDSNPVVVGQVGFNVTGGTISGSNLSATSANLSATDGTVTGTVNGAFFGQQAGSIGGVHDIVKTTEGYSASNVGVFLVDKVTAPTETTSGAILTMQQPQ